MSQQAETFRPPNLLKAKLGNRFANIDASAIARAEAALASMSDQFGDWLDEEMRKLEAAHAVVRKPGSTDAEMEDFYRRAHDLKGLGTTYGFPIVSQFASSLCKLIDSPQGRAKAPAALLDSHVLAIQAAVRQNVREASHPIGKALLGELASQVGRYATGE
jgi:chemotaxis protein histidine kinase CheA